MVAGCVHTAPTVVTKPTVTVPVPTQSVPCASTDITVVPPARAECVILNHADQSRAPPTKPAMKSVLEEGNVDVIKDLIVLMIQHAQTRQIVATVNSIHALRIEEIVVPRDIC